MTKQMTPYPSNDPFLLLKQILLTIVNVVIRMEKECLYQAKCSFVLCKSDQMYAKQNLLSSSGTCHDPKVLLPPLREDVAQIPLPLNMCKDHESFINARPYFTCCVRLSQEKEPERCVVCFFRWLNKMVIDLLVLKLRHSLCTQICTYCGRDDTKEFIYQIQFDTFVVLINCNNVC